MAANFDNDDAETQYLSDGEYKCKQEPGDETNVSAPLSDSAEEFLKNGLKSDLGILDNWPGIGSFSDDQLLTANFSGGLSQISSLQTPNYLPNSQNHQLFDFGMGNENELLTEVQNVSQILENRELGLHASFSQHSVVSQEDHVQTTEKYVGDYNFRFKFSDMPTKRFQFSLNMNKLFVMPEENVDIQFMYDYEKARAKKTELKLVCFLRNCRPEETDTIQRCVHHATEARTKLESQRGDVSEVDLEKLAHVLVSGHPNANHFRDAKGRLKIEIPVKAPAAGCDYVSQLFSFACMNSCKIGMRKKTASRQWTAVFELQKAANSRVLGRQVFYVKVCACPSRDMTREEKDSNKRPKKTARRADSVRNPTPKRLRTSKLPLRQDNGTLQDSVDELDLLSSQEFNDDSIVTEHELSHLIKKCNKLLTASLSPIPEIKLFGDAFKAYVDTEILKLKNAKKAVRVARQPKPEHHHAEFMNFDERNRQDHL